MFYAIVLCCMFVCELINLFVSVCRRQVSPKLSLRLRRMPCIPWP
jgi:hypothetical protein